MAKIKMKVRKEEKNYLTVEECIAKFNKHNITKNLSDASIQYYKDNLAIFLNVVKADSDIRLIDIETVEDFIIYLKSNTQKNTSSINTVLRAIRAFLYFCMEREYLGKFKILLLKAEENLKEPYTDAELKKLLKRPTTQNWTDFRNWAISNYLLATGNRVNTVVNLKIKDLDFENNVITLNTTKNKKQQIIPMAQSLKRVLQYYLSQYDHIDDDYLFPSENAKKLEADGLKSMIRRYNISRGVTKTSCHLYRHTFAKMFIMNGGGMVQLQKLLGHSTLDMTKKYVNLYGTDLAINYDLFNPLDNLK